MKGIWNFLKRLTKTKTGKAVITIVVGAAVNAVAGDKIGEVAAPIITDTVVGLVDGALGPESIPLAIFAAYLRDKGAKEENGGE